MTKTTVAQTGAAGAAIIMLAWALSLVGIDMPAEVQTSGAVVLMWVASILGVTDRTKGKYEA